MKWLLAFVLLLTMGSSVYAETALNTGRFVVIRPTENHNWFYLLDTDEGRIWKSGICDKSKKDSDFLGKPNDTDEKLRWAFNMQMFLETDCFTELNRIDKK